MKKLEKRIDLKKLRNKNVRQSELQKSRKNIVFKRSRRQKMRKRGEKQLLGKKKWLEWFKKRPLPKKPL